MSDIDRFRPEDRRGVDTLYRRTHGADAAEAIACAGTGSIGAIPTTPPASPASGSPAKVRRSSATIRRCRFASSLKGLEVDGAWGADAMVAPERDRQGLDEALLRAWDRNSGAVLALGVVRRAARRARSPALAANRTSSRAS